MIDPAEKSTEVAAPRVAQAEVAEGMLLDGRLGLFHREQRWLAVADLHYGYEISRRMAGGLWPMWGMETIEERLRALIVALKPRTLILVGDIVDGKAAPEEAIAWMSGLSGLCDELILIEGNHDRGAVTQHFNFLPWYRTDGFFFHHGHRKDTRNHIADGEIEVTGHLHPAVNFNDGAGTKLKLPALAMEREANGADERWILPAFSPWAGGGHYKPAGKKSQCHQWACSTQRVFEVAT